MYNFMFYNKYTAFSSTAERGFEHFLELGACAQVFHYSLFLLNSIMVWIRIESKSSLISVPSVVESGTTYVSLYLEVFADPGELAHLLCFSWTNISSFIEFLI